MKIIMKKLVISRGTKYFKGKEYNLPDEQAKSFIKKGFGTGTENASKPASKK